jgi:hypothetical protein
MGQEVADQPATAAAAMDQQGPPIFGGGFNNIGTIKMGP